MDQTQVFSLGLTFCPDQEVDAFKLIKDVNLFARKLFKVIFNKDARGPPSGIAPDAFWQNN